jgi:CRP-like cAMP-binding protein
VDSGHEHNTFYRIVDGQFEVSKLDSRGNKRLIGTLGPNQFFGEMGVLTGDSRTATVKALGPG